MINSYKELIVWQKSVDLVVEIYKLTAKLPKDELYSMTSQLRRAAVSIPSNIAEGNQRHTTKEYIKFLAIARGSNAELQTQLIICQRINYFNAKDVEHCTMLSDEISKMLNAMIDKLNNP